MSRRLLPAGLYEGIDKAPDLGLAFEFTLSDFLKNQLLGFEGFQL